jgi:hypothetical protein
MAAVAGASPVTITVRTPSLCNSVTSAADSGRGGSLSAMSPASFIAVALPTATANTLKPFASAEHRLQMLPIRRAEPSHREAEQPWP